MQLSKIEIPPRPREGSWGVAFSEGFGDQGGQAAEIISSVILRAEMWYCNVSRRITSFVSRRMTRRAVLACCDGERTMGEEPEFALGGAHDNPKEQKSHPNYSGVG